MSKYKPYPKYKESGVAWLGDVPEGWEINKVKFNLLLQNQKIVIDKQKVIALENIESKRGKYIQTSSTYRGEDVAFQKDDILFGKLRPYLAKVFKCETDGVAFGDLLVFRPNKNMNATFVFYSMISDEFISIVDSSTYGTKMPRASVEFINEIKIATPPLKEQKNIAIFLDQKTQKIDTLIKKQQTLIKLLKEKRQALISHVVTQGVDDRNNWKIKKVKFNLTLQNQKVTIAKQEVIALENIESKSGKYIKTESSYKGEDVTFQKGDVLFGKLRPYLAKVFECENDGVAFGDLLVFRPNKNMDSTFVFYSMLSDKFIAIVDSSTYGTKMPRASVEFINEMLMTTPPLKEQQKIANHLDQKTKQIDTLISKSTQAIELLKERRSALISAVVTGKIDVRDA